MNSDLEKALELLAEIKALAKNNSQLDEKHTSDVFDLASKASHSVQAFLTRLNNLISTGTP